MIAKGILILAIFVVLFLTKVNILRAMRKLALPIANFIWWAVAATYIVCYYVLR